MQAFGPAVLRLGLGVIFVAHGAQKLFGMWGGGGIAGTAAFFDQLGLGPAVPLAVLVGLVEFVGGLMLLLGAFTAVAALPLAVIMMTAIWTVHAPHGFFLDWSRAPEAGFGYEFNLSVIAGLVCLALTGPGALSIDGRRAHSAELSAAGRARLRAGKV
ncbi:DoxX family protein [soil metagenome]|nr:DoxX family protein [Acidobacteriota bacterium]